MGKNGDFWSFRRNISDIVESKAEDTVNYTNETLHTIFRLVPVSMSLNDLERNDRNVPLAHYFYSMSRLPILLFKWE